MIRYHQPPARTVAIIRYISAMGPLPRRRRIPAQRQPDAIRLGYYRAILPAILAAPRALEQVRHEIFRMLEAGRVDWKMDASDRGRQARDLVDRAAAKAAAGFDARELRAAAKEFGGRTSEFQREQLNRQAVAALSVPLSAIERPITDKLEEFAALNVDLIRSVSDRFFDRIRLDVLDAFERGVPAQDLADSFAERKMMSERDAMRIARDQIGKLNGQLNQARQEAIGITAYFWRTANDNRVREEHDLLDGERFEWDDPPDAGTDGEPANPGEAINCRCYAEPDFTEIEDGVEAEEEGHSALAEEAPSEGEENDDE